MKLPIFAELRLHLRLLSDGGEKMIDSDLAAPDSNSRINSTWMVDGAKVRTSLSLSRSRSSAKCELTECLFVCARALFTSLSAGAHSKH